MNAQLALEFAPEERRYVRVVCERDGKQWTHVLDAATVDARIIEIERATGARAWVEGPVA